MKLAKRGAVGLLFLLMMSQAFPAEAKGPKGAGGPKGAKVKTGWQKQADKNRDMRVDRHEKKALQGLKKAARG